LLLLGPAQIPVGSKHHLSVVAITTLNCSSTELTRCCPTCRKNP